MKTAKLWRLAFVMLAAFSLASCSSDDDNNVYEAAPLAVAMMTIMFTKQHNLVAHGKRCITKVWPMQARYSTHSIHSL